MIIQAFKVTKTISSYSLYQAQEKFLKEMQEEVRGVLEVHTEIVMLWPRLSPMQRALLH